MKARKRHNYKLFCGDAFEWLPDRRPNSIHAVVADPPYTMVEYLPDQLEKRRNGNGGVWRLPHNYDGYKRSPIPRFTVLNGNDHRRISEFHNRLAPLLYCVLVPGGHVVVASQNLLSYLVVAAFSGAGFEVRGQIARIVKTLRGGDRPKGAHRKYRDVSVTPRSCWEPWLIFRKPCGGRVRDNLEVWRTGGLRRPVTHLPFSDLIPSSPARVSERKIAPHPSLKPQAFMRQIVRAVLPLGKGVILDPFMGSGSTIAAASSLGLKSIGLEINREYFMLAKRAIPKLSRLVVNGSAVTKVSDPKGEKE